MRTFVYQSTQSFSLPVEKLFPFFADVQNLEKITPPWLGFKVLTPEPVSIEEGSIIDYRLYWRRIPLRWRTRISVWQPPFQFVDEQIRGPYRIWRHQHAFSERNGQTAMTDRVEYAIPGGRLVQRLFVVRDIERIFDYRRRTLAGYFSQGADEGR